jgi:hypothetical protein
MNLDLKRNLELDKSWIRQIATKNGNRFKMDLVKILT